MATVIRRVMPEFGADGPGFAITDRTIDSHVRNLRGKFTALGGHDVMLSVAVRYG